MCKFTSPISHHLRICCPWCNSSQKKELLWRTPHRSILPSSNWSIWMFTQTCRCVLTRVCQCYLEPKKVKKLSPSYLCYFFLLKNFNYIVKDASILHLKSSSSGRPSYFSTSISLGHTPHYHGWPITSHWLLRWRVFDIWFVLTWCPLNYPLFLIPMYIFQICDVFYK